MDGAQDLVEGFGGKIGQGQQIFHIQLEIAFIINIADDNLRDLLLVAVQAGKRQLSEQLVVQR